MLDWPDDVRCSGETGSSRRLAKPPRLTLSVRRAAGCSFRLMVDPDKPIRNKGGYGGAFKDERHDKDRESAQNKPGKTTKAKSRIALVLGQPKCLSVTDLQAFDSPPSVVDL